MDPLAVSQMLLWLVVAGLAVTVFALARQIGVLHERIAPLGALMTDRAVDVGDPAPALEVSDLAGRRVRVGGRRDDDRAQFLLFVSPACPMCKKLLPVARSFARREGRALELVLVGDGGRDEHEAR
jgi:methylamine dehydrogenase accessory protein MauD